MNESSGTAQKTEYSEEFQVLEGKVKRLEKDYRNTIKMTKWVGAFVLQFLQPNPGLRVEDAVYDKLDVTAKNKAAKQPISALGNIMIHTGQGMGDNTVLGQALIRTGEAEKDIGEYWTQFEAETNKYWVTAVQKYIDVDLKDAVAVRRKLEKARLDMDSHKTKLKKTARSLNYTPNLDYKADKESNKVKNAESKFQRLFYSCENKYRMVANETQDNLLLDLMKLLDCQMKYFKTSYERLGGVLEIVKERRKLQRRKVINQNLAGIQAFALYDYTAKNEDEISMKAGDQLIVTDQGSKLHTGEEGYWEVNCNGLTGLVPSNHVGFEKATALYDFIPTSPDELAFKAGDEIIILGKSPTAGKNSNKDTGEEGYWQGFLDGNTGFFPASFVSSGKHGIVSHTGDYVSGERPIPNRAPSFVESRSGPHSPALSRRGTGFDSASTASFRSGNTTNSMPRSTSSNDVFYENGKAGILSSLGDLNEAMMQASMGQLSGNPLNYSDALKDQLFDATQALAMTAKRLVEGACVDSPENAALVVQSGAEMDLLKNAMMRMAGSTDDPSLQQSLLMSAASVANALSGLVSAAKSGNPQLLSDKGKQLVGSVVKLVDSIEEASRRAGEAAQAARGVGRNAYSRGADASNPFEDPVAMRSEGGNDLRQADEEIQRAFHNLLNLKREAQTMRAPGTYDEVLVGDVTDIVGLASALMKAAIVRQEEVAKQEGGAQGGGNRPGTFYKKNSIWSDGFSSCARTISDSVIGLSRTIANYVSDPTSAEIIDRLTAEATVAQTTCTELDYSSRVKGPSAPGHRGLVTASGRLQDALAATVERAKATRSAGRGESAGGYEGDPSGVRYRAKEIDQHAKVLAAEAALSAEREKLQQLRRNEYQ
ncbi:hypothetical protein HK104_006661 [Borealophlyctis nickersoniae]|nr:hypothetical protein HK104_006661 [Borealophlyctis nickersoniae]